MDERERQRRVVAYARVSQVRRSRSSESKSVPEQFAEMRAQAQRDGWTIVAERSDEVGASRYSKRARPGWEDVMEIIRSGDVDTLSMWEVSRASRDRPVYSALIAASAESDVWIAVDGKLHDPNDPDDGFMLDLGGALAVRESAMTSKRTRRDSKARAAIGRPHGALPYGYKRLLDPDTGATKKWIEHPDQAPVVREIARRLLSRESSDSIAADLNDRGIPTGTGKKWRGSNMMKMALRPAYAGLRVYDGTVLLDVKGAWPVLISELDHYQLVAMHRDPARDKFRNPTHVKHLGSGLYRCGREGCDGVMRIVVHHGRRPTHYDCRTCHRVSRNQEPVDEAVGRLMCELLAKPKLLQVWTTSDDASIREAAQEAARLRMKLADVRRRVDADELGLDDLVHFRAEWEPRIRAAEERARPKTVPPIAYDVAGEHAAQQWDDLPIRDRRALVAGLLDVVILPVGRGRRGFDPKRDLQVTVKLGQR